MHPPSCRSRVDGSLSGRTVTKTLNHMPKVPEPFGSNPGYLREQVLRTPLRLPLIHVVDLVSLSGHAQSQLPLLLLGLQSQPLDSIS